MSDARFLVALALISAGAACALASYGLRQWLALEAPQQGNRPLSAGARIGAALVLAGLALSSSALIERMVWILLAAWLLVTMARRAADPLGRGVR